MCASDARRIHASSINCPAHDTLTKPAKDGQLDCLIGRVMIGRLSCFVSLSPHALKGLPGLNVVTSPETSIANLPII